MKGDNTGSLSLWVGQPKRESSLYPKTRSHFLQRREIHG